MIDIEVLLRHNLKDHKLAKSGHLRIT